MSLEGHDQTVWTAAFSPSGKLLATGSLDQTAKIWNPTNGELLQTIWVNFPVVSLAFNHRGDRLVTVGPEDSACVWPIQPGDPSAVKEPLWLKAHTRAVTTVAWSPDDRWIATGSKDRRVILWNAISGSPCRTWVTHTNWVLALAFAPNSKLLASGGADRTVRLWDIRSGHAVCVLTNHPGTILSLAFSPQGDLLASGAERSGARVWDARSWRQLHALVPGSHVSCVAFSPDGGRLVTAPGSRDLYATGDRASRIVLWDLGSGQELLGFIAHTNAVYGITFSPDGRHLVTTSGDKTAKIWTAFPWHTKDYPGNPADLLPVRIEQFKRQFARTWSQAPSPSGRETVRHYFGDLNVAPPGSKTRPLFPIPARSPAATPRQLDLWPSYNVALNESWEPIDDVFELDHNLCALGAGLKDFAGVTFEVRGLIQLCRAAPDCESFPERVAVAANQRFRRVHALHGTRWVVAEDVAVACFVLHYANGTQVELPVVYGQHVRVEDVNDPLQQGFGPECSKAVVAWMGPAAREPAGWQTRLYLATFENPHPEPGTTLST